MELTENKMGTAPVGRHLLTMSLPLMLSMLFEAFYNVVDSLFVSHVSEKALTAVSLAFPIQLLVVSVTVGTGVGINAILSRSLGEKNQKGVDSAAYNGIFLALLSYIVFLIFGLFLTRAYFTWQSNDPEIVQYGVDYLSICMVFSFGASGQIAFQRLLQSTGRTGLSMVSQLAGAIFNIIFDPILIFGLCGFPAMGTKGAAIATVAGQILALGIAVFFNLAKNKEIHFKFQRVRPSGKMIAEIYKIGIPAIIMQALNSVMAFGVNVILISISSTVVAAFGIYIKVQNFIFMPAFGVNNGVIAMTAYNYGAKNKRRIDETIKYGTIYAGTIMVIGIAIMHFLAAPILTVFDASAELMSIGIVAMRVISLSFIFVALTLIMQGVYNGLGNGMYSLIITLCRVVVILLPVLYIFTKLFTLNTVWRAFVLAEGGSAVVGAFLLKKIYKQKVANLANG
ncbi:MAG: MATE family efflux transporter [Treponema sp.]|nr:MATE family efflux transporter [Treponema sp.]